MKAFARWELFLLLGAVPAMGAKLNRKFI